MCQRDGQRNGSTTWEYNPASSVYASCGRKCRWKPRPTSGLRYGTCADTEPEQEKTRASNNVAEITAAVAENVAEKPDKQADCEIGTRADTEPEQEETRASNNVFISSTFVFFRTSLGPVV